jgi:serine/threonine protein kinase
MSAPNAIERVVAGRYVLLSPLGRGGMGTVWKGEDSLLKRGVAVKEVEFPGFVPEAERAHMQARALREARAAARIAHPGAVTVFDVRQEDGKAYIVMELFEAPTLEELVDMNGPFDPRRAAQIGLQVAGALEAAHREGIVHRDVKPGNVMVASDGRVKLADFGIASLKDDPKITATGLVLGSPSYMAPEQAQGRPSGPAVDLWALGATLYSAVEGAPAFDKGQAIPTLTAVIEDEPRPMRRAGPLKPVIRALLSKEPQDRPLEPQLRKMLRDVAESDEPRSTVTTPIVRDDARTLAPVAVAGAYAAGTYDGAPDDGGDRYAWVDEERSRRWIPLAGGLAILAVIAALLVWGFSRANRPATATHGERSGAASGRERATSPSPTTSQPLVVVSPSAPAQPSTSPAPTPSGAAPPGWTPYTVDDTGYQISHPPGWTVVPNSTGDGTSVDFRDPSTGSYMRVDWTDSPRPSAVGAWRSLERSFSSNPANGNYRRIRIVPATFKGMRAAVWEFTYSNGGAQLHAIDIGIVIPDGRQGFALNFQTHASKWASSQGLLRRFEASFTPTR